MGRFISSTAASVAGADAHHDGPNFYRGGHVIIGDEIQLAADLATAARLSLERDELARAMARNPAGLFGRFAYGRSVDQWGEVVIRRERRHNELPVGNVDILFPSDPAWPTFLETLKQFSNAYDYPGRVDHHGWSTSNWGAARALHAMGYAVAESLAMFSLAGAGTDDCIEYNLAESWEATANGARAGARAARRSQVRGRKRPR
jgi:hypothetical protein